ncbi:MAG: transketolase [bacterium]
MKNLPDTTKIRENILRCAVASGHGHIPTSFSIVEALVAVYATMKHDPGNPLAEDRDLFVLSKGHAALGYYCVLAEYGYLTLEECMTIGTAKSRLGCHPDRLKIPGVEASTGSLGHGIGIAAGMALGIKIRGSSRKVYTLVGDGEANEGSVWEAIMVAVDQKLHNLTILYDDNRSQVRCLQIPNPLERLAAFGCDAQEVDGHDVNAILAALRTPAKGVKAIVCRTEKGRGCATLLGDFHAWHRRSPSQAELDILLRELHAQTV